MWLIVVFMFTSGNISGDFAIGKNASYSSRHECMVAQEANALKMEKMLADAPIEGIGPPTYTVCVRKIDMRRIQYNEHTL
jgi:hypothetical protein